MDDQSIPSTHIEVQSPKQEKKQRNKIDLLPNNIKTELLRLIAQGHGSQTCHKQIHDKYGTDPHFSPFSRRTLQSYMTSQKEIMESRSIPNRSSEVEHVHANPSNYHDLVYSQFHSFTRLLDSMQSSADRSDPEFNNDLIRVQKEWRSLLELVHKLQEQGQGQDTDERLEHLLRRNQFFLMTGVQKAIERKYGKEAIESIKPILIEELKTQTDNYKKTYEIKGEQFI